MGPPPQKSPETSVLNLYFCFSLLNICVFGHTYVQTQSQQVKKVTLIMKEGYCHVLGEKYGYRSGSRKKLGLSVLWPFLPITFSRGVILFFTMSTWVRSESIFREFRSLSDAQVLIPTLELYLLIWPGCLHPPPKLVCWNPNDQYDGRRRDSLWEVLRAWGWSPQE